MMDIRRKIDGTLSEGRGIQLLWISIIIGICFLLFWGVAVVFFDDNPFRWKDIIALFLDPGVFQDDTRGHDGFRLIVTFFGIFLLAAVLISIVSNIFINISDSFRKGESRYRFHHHILILGGSHFLFDILKGIEKDEKKIYHNRQIVVMTIRQTDELRDEVAAFLNNKKYLKRITFYYDKRDNEENLKGAYAEKADYIFVIGEDKEPSHDLINIRCCNLLHTIVRNKKTECYIIMDSQTTMQLFFPELRGLRNSKGELIYDTKPPQVAYTETFLNINEAKAEYVLSNTVLKLINLSKTSTTNIVIFGMNSFGRALAITIARTFHFCKKKEEIKTKIVIIDSGLKAKTNDFISRNQLLFDRCDYKYVSDEVNLNREKTKFPLANDETKEISWLFVDADPSSEIVYKYLENLQRGNKLINTFSFVCFDDISKNIATDLNLRNKYPLLKVFADFGDFENDLFLRLGGLNSDSISSFFSYIFNERQEKVGEYYNANPINNFDWKNLYYGDRQLVTYKATVSILKERSKISDDVFDFKTCSKFAQYMMGISNNGDMDSKGLFYDEREHYMDQIREQEQKNPLFNKPHDRDYFKKLEDNNSEEYKEYQKYEENIETLYKRIQGQYIYSLQQNKEECDIADYLYYLLLNHIQLDLNSFEEFMMQLLRYVDNTRFSERTTLALLSYCKPEYNYVVKDGCYEYHDHTNIPPKIVNLSKEIIKCQANKDQNGTYSYLAMSIICNEYEDMKNWYKKLVDNDANKQYIIPNYYYGRIGIEHTERLFHDTKSELILDWLILSQVPIIHSNNYEMDIVFNVEEYIKNLTGLVNEELFYRLGITKGLNSCFQGMWLQKAERAANENDSISILFKSSLQLIFYFNSRDKKLATSYFNQAKKLIKENKDFFIENMNNFTIDDVQSEIENTQYISIINKVLNQLKAKSHLEQGHRKDIDSLIWKDGIQSANIPFEEDVPLSEQEDLWIESFEERQKHQNEIDSELSKIQNKISSWKEEFPDIEHPYGDVLSELLQEWNSC